MATAISLLDGAIYGNSIDINSGTGPLGTTALTITSAQAVNIAVSLTSPDTTFTGQITANASTGTVGDVLTSGGPGVAPSWTTPTSGKVYASALGIIVDNVFDTIKVDQAANLTWTGTETFSNIISLTGELKDHTGSIGNAGDFLISNGVAGTVSWTSPGGVVVASANNLTGPTGNSIPYQASAGVTAYLSPAASGVLVTNGVGTAPSFSTTPALTGTNFTSIPNGALVNSSITVNGVAFALGDSKTITAATPAALTIGTGLAGTAATFDGSAAVTVSLDVAHANTWTATQTFDNNSLVVPTGSYGTVTDAPTNATDITNKLYVDSVAQGLVIKTPVTCATVTDLGAIVFTPSGTGVGTTITDNNGGFGIFTADGIAPTVGDRVLVKNQLPGAEFENGIYVLTQNGDNTSIPWVLTRATDDDTWAEMPNAYCLIQQGTTQAQTGWTCTSPKGGTIDVTPVTFVQFSGANQYAAGAGLTLTGNVFSVSNTTVVVGTYGSATQVPVIAVNSRGQITSATNTNIAITLSQVTDAGTIASQNANNVAITGGSVNGVTIDGATIGGTTPGAATFNSLTTTGGSTVTLNGTISGTGLATFINSTIAANSGPVSASNLTITGTFSANGSVGTAGQVLTSAGVGSPAVWSSLTSGTSILIGDGSGNITNASSADIIAAIGANPVQQAAELDTTTWVVKETASGLSFYKSGVIVGQIDASGNLKVTGSVTAFAGTITP